MKEIAIALAVAGITAVATAYITTEKVLSEHGVKIQYLTDSIAKHSSNYEAAAEEIIKLKMHIIKHHPNVDLVSLAAAEKLTLTSHEDMVAISHGITEFQESGGKIVSGELESTLKKNNMTKEDFNEYSSAVVSFSVSSSQNEPVEVEPISEEPYLPEESDSGPSEIDTDQE